MQQDKDTGNACPRDWFQTKRKCYKFFMNFQSWQESRESCSVRKLSLLMIEDRAELEFIQNEVQGGVYFWIGLHLPDTQKTWAWLDGAALNLQLFQVAGQAGENACALVTHQGVFSEKCAISSHWICQQELSSSTATRDV
ncbi:killer cell lectin-like receptor subfamily B member 1F [Thomomys bottae]